MIAAGCARKLVFSWAGNPGAGSLHAFRRAVEQGTPPLELEEYSHFGMVARMSAGAAGLPFWVHAQLHGDRPSGGQSQHQDRDLSLHRRGAGHGPGAQPRRHHHPRPAGRCAGNAQVWGLLGVQKEAAFASKRVIVVVEELVDESVIRADPNRTLIPGHDRRRGGGGALGLLIPPTRRATTTATTISTWPGRTISRDPAQLQAYLDEFVYGVTDRAEYMAQQPAERSRRLRAGCGSCRTGWSELMGV